MADANKKKFIPADNPAEILKDSFKEVGNVPKQILDEAFVQIGLKERKTPMSGEINLKTGEKKEQKAPILNNLAKEEKQVYNARQKAVETQIAKLMEQLHEEVTKLSAQTAELTHEVQAMAVESAPSQVGIYHLNFFDWVMNTLKDLRKTVNESRMWLHLWTQKKKQKGYWAMSKKHGQKFQFSDERSVATAAG